MKAGKAPARRFAAGALLAIAACATARREVPPEVPPEEIPELVLEAPFEPRWWIEVVPREDTLELVLPQDSCRLRAPVPADRRVEVPVQPGGGLPPGLQERIAAHAGEPLVAFVNAGPDACLRDVLDTLRRLHEAGIRRFDPAAPFGPP